MMGDKISLIFQNGYYKVVNNNGKSISEDTKNSLKSLGIYIFDEEDIEKLINEAKIGGLDYDFLVLNWQGWKQLRDILVSNNGEIDYALLESLPARIVVFGKGKEENNEIKSNNGQPPKKENQILQKRIAFVEDNIGIKSKDPKEFVKELMEALYRSWCNILYKPEEIQNILYINTKGENKEEENKRKLSHKEYNMIVELLLSWWSKEEQEEQEEQEEIDLNDSDKDILIQKVCKEIGDNNSLYNEDEVDNIDNNILKYKLKEEYCESYNKIFYLVKAIKNIKYLMIENRVTPNIFKRRNIREQTEIGNKDISKIIIDRHAIKPPMGEFYYFESLSGSSNHFNIYNEYVRTRNEILFYRILEMAIWNIYIVDERVGRFLENEDVIKERFHWANIYGFKDWIEFKDYEEKNIIKKKSNTQIGNLKIASHSNDSFKRGKESDNNILIIHQGIIDKTEEITKSLLKSKRELYPFIFITSGRGIPENIFDSVKFIPFSVIEDNLLKPHFSKMNLVNVLFRSMNRR